MFLNEKLLNAICVRVEYPGKRAFVREEDGFQLKQKILINEYNGLVFQCYSPLRNVLNR